MKMRLIRMWALLLVLTLVSVGASLTACDDGTSDVTAPATTGAGPQGETTVTGVIGSPVTALPVATGLPEAVPGVYTDLTPEQAKQLIDTTPELVIVDVSPVYADGHLPGAVSYYVGDGSLEAALPTLDQSVPYLVYCHTDSASIAGAQALVDAGFPMVYRLQGNYSAWVAAGYPVERP